MLCYQFVLQMCHLRSFRFWSWQCIFVWCLFSEIRRRVPCDVELDVCTHVDKIVPWLCSMSCGMENQARAKILVSIYIYICVYIHIYIYIYIYIKLGSLSQVEGSKTRNLPDCCRRKKVDFDIVCFRYLFKLCPKTSWYDFRVLWASILTSILGSSLRYCRLYVNIVFSKTNLEQNCGQYANPFCVSRHSVWLFWLQRRER